MARVISPVWTTIRGSIGGTTYTANQFHPIIARARVAPTQPNTNPQTSIRAALDSAQDTWAGLTELQQDAWNLYAAFTPFPGPLGPVVVPGRQMFLAGRTLQNFVEDRGFAVPTFVTTAPGQNDGFLNVRCLGPATPVGPGTGIAVSVTADRDLDTLAFMQISAAFSTSRKRFKGPWNDANAIAVIIPANTTVLMEILGLLVDSVYFTRIKCVGDDGPPRVSGEFFHRHIAQTIGP